MKLSTAKIRFLGAVAVSLIVASSGCGKSNISPLSELSVDPVKSQEAYTIQAGDILDVQVWGEPRLSGEVLVREDGKFTMQLVNDVEAEGKTAKDVRAAITEGLKEFIPSASVSVSVTHTAPTRYFLSGQFQKAGEYRSDKQITLLQAIATGGGFAPFADDSSIILIRRGPSGELRYELDYSQVVEGKEPNPVLRNGDIIAVK
jgi:polysaccharide export outer membrane protein